MKKILLTASSSIAALVLMFLGASSAYALKVSPSIIDNLRGNPGDVFMASFKVVNDTADRTVLYPKAMDASGSSNEGGYAAVTEKNESSTLANWISFNYENISLDPGEAKNVSFAIAIPENAPKGGHYAVVSLGTKSGATVQMGASVNSELGVNIALDVLGDVTEKGDVLTFSTADGKTSYDKLPVSFITRINNGGNRHFKPQGAITVKNMFGSAVATLPVNVTNGGGNVLPRSTREFTNEWQGEFAFGKYTALLNVDLGGAGVKAASLDLWVMPAGLLVLWLIIALIILVILVLLIRRALLASPAMKK